MEESSFAGLFAGLNVVDEERSRKREMFPSDSYAEHAARKLSSACLFDKLISPQLRPGISILRGSTLVRFPRRLMSHRRLLICRFDCSRLEFSFSFSSFAFTIPPS
jgi:hypothetical protein